jgi:DNA invertase Pin-like site-specific DNA recombinase/translation initiation factor 2 beta subunit (eIF-2beta)/eIF-5/transposase
MIENGKIKPTHLQRCAYVYVRQSTAAQVEYNRESTKRQYKLAERAIGLGWSKQQVKVIDEDLAQSGSSSSQRRGFTTMTADVALGQVGLILSIEVSRVARNNADWYRLLDLCSVTDTLIGDEDGLYPPGLFNDRLLLGLKGTMAEAELHVIRARLEGGIRNKAARGELRRGLPVGFIWGEHNGEILMHPDQAVTGAIHTVFEKFAQMGSVRQVWLWFQTKKLRFPLQTNTLPEIKWVAASYHAIHSVLTNPVYAGVYAYGKTRQQCFVDETGQVKKRVKRLPQSQWAVFIHDHHKGFIDWETYELIKKRIAQNTRPVAHKDAGAIREGAALLQGLATCGKCGRRLRVYYQGKHSTPGYYCAANKVMEGRAEHCMRVGGVKIDNAVTEAFLDAITPAAMEAALLAEKSIEAEHDAAIAQWQLQVERLSYEADRAERRYRAVEPENRLVARTLETQWELSLNKLKDAQKELDRRQRSSPKRLTADQRTSIRNLGKDLTRVWQAPTTTHRDRKQLLQMLLEEVNIAIKREESKAHLILRWKAGVISELDVNLLYRRVPPIRTDQDTIELVRRLAAHYPDAVITGILNRQGRKTARGDRFTVNKVGNLRRYWKIPRFDAASAPSDGELVTIKKAADILGVAASTVHRWLADGFIAGEQITAGAPWQIRMSEAVRSRFVEKAPEGYVTMKKAKKILGVSRQTVLQRVKSGKLAAVHVRKGKQIGIYIKLLNNQRSLF